MAGNNPATQNTGDGSIIAADNSTNLANVIRELKNSTTGIQTWMKKLYVVLGVTRRDTLPLLDPNNTVAFELYTKSNKDIYAIRFLHVKLPAALWIQRSEDDNGINGDGQAAFHKLCNNYDRVTKKAGLANMEELDNTPIDPGANPDN